MGSWECGRECGQEENLRVESLRGEGAGHAMPMAAPWPLVSVVCEPGRGHGAEGTAFSLGKSRWDPRLWHGRS